MALIKPLKLKSEKVSARQERATVDPVAHVVVDTGVFHLDEPYSYLVPQTLENSLVIGSIVKVPFGRKTTEGVVIARNSVESTAGLKFIDEQISRNPVLTLNQIELFRAISERYGCSLWDVIRLAVPAYSAAADKKIAPVVGEGAKSQNHAIHRLAYELSQGESPAKVVIALKDKFAARKVLVVVPDEKALQKFCSTDFILLSGESPRSAKFGGYLKANGAESGIFVGLRSSIFIDLGVNDLLVVLDETDSNMYERHMPTYNARDVALLKSQHTSTVFLSTTRSLEVQRLIDMGFFAFSARKSPQWKVITENDHKVHGVISEGLKKGSVLLLHASAGYVKSFSCNKCRNIALSKCGERFVLGRDGKSASCNLCGEKVERWRCGFCSEATPRALSQGVVKRAEEYARSFPGFRVIHSSGEHYISKLPEENCLVLATPGMEPEGDYAAVLLMDGEQIFGRTGLRSDEMGELHWLKAANKVVLGGTLYISLPLEHPLSQSLIRGSSGARYLQLLREREEAHLPPNFRLIAIEGEPQEISQASDFLRQEHGADGMEFLGPLDVTPQKSRLVVKFPVESGNKVVRLIHEFNRVRSLQGQGVLRVSVDPLDFI